MKSFIKKILKEEGEGLKERFIKNMKSLEYLIQRNIKTNIIEELEFVDIRFYEKYKDISEQLKLNLFLKILILVRSHINLIKLKMNFLG